MFASHEDYDTHGTRVLAAFLRHEPTRANTSSDAATAAINREC